MNNQSSKHHYVPQFYLKGFQNEESNVFALKKERKSIKKWKTAQILYKNDLHTVSFNGNKAVIIEDYYSEMESSFKEILTLFDEKENHIELASNLDVIRIIKLMISQQFWRTPKPDVKVDLYSKNLIDLYDSSSLQTKEMLNFTRKDVKYFQKNRMKSNHRKVIQFCLLPLLTFEVFNDNIAKLDFFHLNNLSVEKLITSDNPVIFDKVEELFSFKQFAYPLTENILVLFNTDINKINVSDINKIIFKKAGDMVISSSKEQLNELVVQCL